MLLLAVRLGLGYFQDPDTMCAGGVEALTLGVCMVPVAVSLYVALLGELNCNIWPLYTAATITTKYPSFVFH